MNTITFADGKSVGVLPLTIILGVLSSFAPFSIDMYLTGFPAIAAELETGLGLVQLTLSVFFIGLALGQLFYGPLIDRFGRRIPLLAGMALFAASSLGLTFVGDIGSFIALRFLQAVGGCAGMVVGRAIVKDCFDLKGAAKMFSMMAVVQAIGPIAAPLLGSYIVTYLGWRSNFSLLCLLGLGCFGAIYLYIPESQAAAQRQAQKPREIASTFIALLSYRKFLIPCLAGAVAGAALFAFIGGSPFVIMSIYGFSHTEYGWLFASIAVGMSVAGQAGSVLLKKTTPQRLLWYGVGITTVFGSVILFLTATMGVPPFPLFFIPLALALVCTPIIVANSAAVSMNEGGKTQAMLRPSSA